MERKARMAAPDIIKIAATIFVILIHHKTNNSDLTMVQHNLFFMVLLVVSVVLGVVLFLRASKVDSDKRKCLEALFLPIVAGLSFVFLKKFAVGFFLIISGYLMSGTLGKEDMSFRQWYNFRELIPRIVRFYVPLISIFFVALLYKICILGKSYSLLEIVVRFFLGGFKPGGYYVTILVQLVLLIPLIHGLVKRYKYKGVIMCVCFTLIYDVLATAFGMNGTLYKFLIFRLMAHIAFGVYMRYADFDKDKICNILTFIIGLVYVICCVFTEVYKPGIFFRWDAVSVISSFFLYPLIALFINKFNHIKYTDSGLSRYMLLFANATYHIFLIQMLYYTTVGFAFNKYIDNAAITLGLNVIITVPAGILYFRFMNPIENKIMSKLKSK